MRPRHDKRQHRAGDAATLGALERVRESWRRLEAQSDPMGMRNGRHEAPPIPGRAHPGTLSQGPRAPTRSALLVAAATHLPERHSGFSPSNFGIVLRSLTHGCCERTNICRRGTNSFRWRSAPRRTL